MLSSADESVGIAVENLQVIPELLRRVVSSSSPINTSPTLFESPFYDIQAVTITPLELQTTQRYILSNVTTTGFSADFLDGTSTIQASYSYTATGYGRKL